MRHHNLQVTGSVSVNGISAATAADLGAYTSSADIKISTLQLFTASVGTTNTFTASAILRLNDLETKSASVDTTNTTQNNRLNSLEEKTGSLATTGSNTFYGTQVFSGSLYVQDNLIVQGSSSLQNITASAVSIGTNIVNLNTANPAVRYGGISVQDSGSASGVTGSMLWDSTCNRWIYSNPSGVGYSGGIIMSGPRASTLGTETTLTCNYIAKSGGGDHLYDSCIYENNGNVGINTTSPDNITTYKSLHIVGGGVSTGGIFTTSTCDGSLKGRFLTSGGEISIGSVTNSPVVMFTNDTVRISISNTGITCFSCQICSPSIVSCNGTMFLQRGANGCNGLTISEQGGGITADKSNSIRTAGGTSEHLFLTAGINANTSAGGYIKLGGDRYSCVGINTAPTFALDVCSGDAQTAKFARYCAGTGISNGQIAEFVNLAASGYSSYIYIGSAPGTDWKIGKNVTNCNANYDFTIVDSNNSGRMRITPTGEVCFACQVCSPILVLNNSSSTGTMNMGTISTGGVANQIIGSQYSAYAYTGTLSFRVGTWGAGSDYAPTEQMKIEVQGPDTKASRITMIPNGGSVIMCGDLQTIGFYGKSYGVTCTVGSSVSIIDTGISIPNNSTYLVSFTANPATAGGVYSWTEVGYLVINSQWNGSSNTQLITYTKAAGGGTSVYPGAITVYPYFLVSGTEYTQTTSYAPSGQIRLKFCGFSNSPGASQTTYLTRIM